MNQRAFEIKYLLSPAQAVEIRRWAREHLDADPNADGAEGDSYRTTSIYFDTDGFDIFHRKGSFAKIKYRIRRYGTGDLAFLERKLKIKDTVSKRRSLVEIEDLKRLGGQEPRNGWSGFWFHRRLLARRLKPVCQISYLRTARVRATLSGPIRLTMDEDIHAFPLDNLGFMPLQCGARLSKNQYILELKYHDQMPAIFKELVERFRLNPKPFSKYRTAAVALGYVAEPVARA